MKYFHRTTVSPDAVIHHASVFFAPFVSPVEEGNRRRRFSGPIGQLSVSTEAEGGHYTLVTVETNQPGESEIDKLGKRFLAQIHTLAEPDHAIRGAY
jgi:hypothetical protein